MVRTVDLWGLVREIQEDFLSEVTGPDEEGQGQRTELFLMGWPLKSWPGFSWVSEGLGTKEEQEILRGVSVLLKA